MYDYLKKTLKSTSIYSSAFLDRCQNRTYIDFRILGGYDM